MSVGFVGRSDGWQDLSQHFEMEWEYTRAENGNVALSGEIDLAACNGEFVLAIGEVDTFSCYIAGPAWRMGLITETVIQGWARSRDWCWRRAALVSTVPLNAAAHGGKGDTKRTLAICGILVHDRHDMVVKAMSWALRTLAMRDAKVVRRFLADHQGDLGARIIREVNNKLKTGLKNPRKRRRSA
jgi:hypothetical protein